MLLENSFFGTIDKVAEAIENLKKYEPSEGYYVAFSGGKDSVVILDLVKRAGVKFEAHHHIMTIEPPELMQFIFKQYPEVINDRPAKTMHQLIVQYGFPPLRQIRYCCWELKSSNGKNRIKVTGVRAEESPRRAKQAKVEINKRGGELRLIHDWTAAEVWEYIQSRKLPYCKLYDEGKKRIGCIFCPFARERENIENALKYPQYVRYFITACERAIKTRTEQGKTSKYNSGAEMFVAWIEGGRGKKLKDFGVKFDYEKGEIVMENNGTANGNVPALQQYGVKISLEDFNTILLHAEKISNGQLDFVNVLCEESKNKLGIENADALIDTLKANDSPDIHNQTRLFLAQFNFIIEGNDTNYRLVKFSDNHCGLDIISENTVAIVPAESIYKATPALNIANELDSLSVERLTMEAKFYFAQMGQNAIEFGKRLIAIKKKLPHGQWLNWLENNFHLKQSSAKNFIAIAERFGNRQTFGDLGYSQMLALVSLPEGEEEAFLEAQKAAGEPDENQTIKKLNQNVKKWKKKADEKTAEADNLKKENEELKKKNEELKKDNDLKLDVNRSNAEEYFRMKAEKEREISELQAKNAELEKKLEEPVVEVIPEDYEQTKEELAKLKAREENFREELATSQALNQFFMMANFLQERKDSLPEVLKGYVETDGLTSQRINQIAFVSSLLKKILKDIS